MRGKKDQGKEGRRSPCTCGQVGCVTGGGHIMGFIARQAIAPMSIPHHPRNIGVQEVLEVTSSDPGRNYIRPSLELRWAKSRDSYRRIASESYRCDSNRQRSLELISLPQNIGFGPRRPCVRCVAIRIARLAFIGVVFVPRGTAEWPARVDRFRCRKVHASVGKCFFVL